MGRNNCVDKWSVKKYKKVLCYPFRSVAMCIIVVFVVVVVVVVVVEFVT